MRWKQELRFIIRRLIHLRRAERELDEEIRAHLEMEIEQNVAGGMSPEEARSAARRSFGSVALAKEDSRAMWGLGSLEIFWQDLRYGMRILLKHKGFTTVAVLTLALGIGANTAIFSVVNGVILRPLRYPKPEELVYLSTYIPGFGRHPVSPPEYFEFREFNRSFADVGAYTTGAVNLTAGDRPLRARSAAVDGNLLSALGIQAAHGRLFARGETDVTGPWFPGNPRNMQPPSIVILSHELWQTAFGGRPIIGETVDVDGRRREVVGVMPPGD